MEEALSAVHDLKAFWFLDKPVEPRAFRVLSWNARFATKGVCSRLAIRPAYLRQRLWHSLHFV
jgi:hypothetical protein